MTDYKLHAEYDNEGDILNVIDDDGRNRGMMLLTTSFLHDKLVRPEQALLEVSEKLMLHYQFMEKALPKLSPSHW